MHPTDAARIEDIEILRAVAVLAVVAAFLFTRPEPGADGGDA